MKRFILFTALMLLCFTALDAQTPRQSLMLENGHAVGRASEYQKTADEGSRPLSPVKNRDKNQNKEERVFRFENLPVKQGVARKVTVAGVIILVRGVSSLDVTCKGKFDGDILSEGKVTMSDGNWMEGTFEDGVLVKKSEAKRS